MSEDQIRYNCNACGLDITNNRIGDYIKCFGCGNCGSLESTAIPSRLEQVAQTNQSGENPKHPFGEWGKDPLSHP